MVHQLSHGKVATHQPPPGRVWRRGRSAWLLWGALVWISASGASCPRVLQQYTQPIPRALPPAATLTQIIDVVNDNSAKVQSVSTSRATITSPGMPSLNANIAFQRPRSFRLVAQKFVGPEVDLGSNNDLMWFWIKRAQPPALLFCRHDQFATSSARQILPVEPEWLIEAMGVVTFDKNGQIDGPSSVGNGRLEVRTRSGTPGQMVSRVTIIDESRGVVLEEHLYDAKGVRLASASLSKHVHDPASGATLPRHVEIQLPASGQRPEFALTIDMGDVQVNQLVPTTDLFAKPTYSGYNEFDLAQPTVPIAPGQNGRVQAPGNVRY